MKQVRLITATGDYSDFTPEEVIARSMHEFIGWRCSAGLRGLFIDWDGNVHRGTCQVGMSEPLGTLASGFTIPIEWMTCNKRHCVCNLEITLPKARTIAIEELARGAGLRAVDDIAIDSAVAATSSIGFDRESKYVMWALGRRCNYDCSYCDDVAHDMKSPHTSREHLFAAVDTLHREFARGEIIRYAFSGGEPTLNPAFLDLVRHLAAQGHVVGTTTNGSRTAEYYRDLFTVSHINFSVHFEYVREERLVESTRALVELRRSDDRLRDRWLGFQLMVPPGVLPRAQSLGERIRALIDGVANTSVAFVPVRQRNTNDLMSYPGDELIQLERANR